MAAGVAVAGTVAVMASTGIAQHLEKQQQMKSVLSAAIEEVRDTDEAIIAFDEQVLMSADNRSEDDVQAAIQEVESIAPLLDSAYEQAQIASEKLVRAGQRETARQTMLDIEARRQMIEHGSRLLEESAYEKDAVDKMEQVWQLILQGDELSSQAADLVTDTTESNVNASMEKSNQAIEAFESALDLVEQVQDEYPKADVSDYYIYIEKRIEGQKAAVECDAYILLKDSESASESSKRLYEYDVQAAKVSERFPDDVTQVITEAQGAQIADLREKYTQARAQVASCDAHLREYLGESNK